ncbi:MAG: retention module-containing protein, partial [Gammaproteobacteria bacterium]
MVKLVDQSHTSTVTDEAIGFVREMTRFVTAVDGKGIERDLSVGDPVYNNELIQTIGNSLVVLDFIDGTHLDLGKRSKVLLDDEVFNPDFIGDANNMAADVELIQALILSGIDPAIVTEETAAGVPRETKPKNISNDESSRLSSGIIIDLTGQQTTPESGYETYGLESTYQQSQLELFDFLNNAEAVLTVAVTSFTTNDNTPEITGTVNNPSASVIVVINGNSYAATNNGDGSWTLNDNSIPDLNLGDSSVEVIVTDEKGNTDSSTGVITVINNNPMAGSDSKTAMEDGMPVNGVVPVATDIDGDLDPMSYTLVTDVSEGSLTFNPDGSYYFNPGPDFQDLGVGESRDITFSYTVNDTRGGTSTPAVITITVTGANDAPVVSGPVSDTATENDAVFNLDFLSGATDVDVSDNLSIANLNLTGGDASGVVLMGNSLSVDPSIYKSLAAGETEVITYSYDVIDNQGGVTPQTATITIVGTNNVPVVTDVGITVIENSTDVSLSLPLPTDLDASDSLTITVTGLPTPGLGAVTLSDGTPLVNGQALSLLEFQGLQFDTVPSAIGASSFTYSVTDGLATVTGTATITVNGLNNNPFAVDNQYTINEDVSYSGNVLTDDTGAGIDSDLDGDALLVSAVNGQTTVIGTAITLASGATLTMQSDGSFVYDASTSSAFNALSVGASTNDSFNYTISDGSGGSDQASVTVTINGSNDAAVVSSENVTLTETDAVLSTGGTLTSIDVD